MKKSGEARRRAQDGASCSKCTELFESERNSAFRLKVPKQANRQMAHRGTSYEAYFYFSALTGVASVAAEGDCGN